MQAPAPLARVPGPVALWDYVGTGWGRQVGADGTVALVRSTVDGRVRTLDRFDPTAARMLDRTVFRTDGVEIVEAERYTTRGGPNLHPAPLRLPAWMRVGDECAPLPGAVARLVHAGPASWAGLTLDCIALAVGQRGEERVLWSGRGVGELLLEGHWALTAWAGLYGELSPPAAAPELPDVADGGRPDGVY